MEITCGIYLYNTLTENFLICHATRSKNLWSIPKGLKEEAEKAYVSATRELFEETNIDVNKIHVLKVRELPAVKYKKRNKMLESFLLITDSDLSPIQLSCHSIVNGAYPEIDKYKWVNENEMRAMIHESQVQNMDLIEQFINEYNQKN